VRESSPRDQRKGIGSSPERPFIKHEEEYPAGFLRVRQSTMGLKEIKEAGLGAASLIGRKAHYGVIKPD
jgi:hypothetical protein